jgi:hypothetical protein
MLVVAGMAALGIIGGYPRPPSQSECALKRHKTERQHWSNSMNCRNINELLPAKRHNQPALSPLCMHTLCKEIVIDK